VAISLERVLDYLGDCRAVQGIVHARDGRSPARPTGFRGEGYSNETERAATLNRALLEVTVGGGRREWTAPEEMKAAF
jgi:hypothetical protein